MVRLRETTSIAGEINAVGKPEVDNRAEKMSELKIRHIGFIYIVQNELSSKFPVRK